MTPKVGLTYQVTPDDMVYATVAKGYRIGGATPPLPVAGLRTRLSRPQYNSDTVWSYEVGTKDRFFDRTAAGLGAASTTSRGTTSSRPSTCRSAASSTPPTPATRSARASTSRVSGRLRHNFEIDGTVGYTDATFTKTALRRRTANVLDAAGDALDVAPWTVTLGAQYNFTLVDRAAFVRADYEFNSKRTTPIPDEDPRTTYYDPGLVPDPATNQVTLRGGLNFGPWDLALYCNNLLNAHPQLNLQHQDEFTLLYEAQTFRPRTIGLSANVKF